MIHWRSVAYAVTAGAITLGLSACTHNNRDDDDQQGHAHHSMATDKAAMNIQKSDFGKTNEGEAVELYTLTNKHGMTAKIATYGATLVELWVPDKNGQKADVVLGFDNIAQYQKESPFFGATTGRIANRIAKGKFTVDGKQYQVATNNGPNHLHGGPKGFDKQIWKAEELKSAKGA